MISKNKVLPYVACALIVVQLLLVLVSWIWSAAVPASGVRSLLSGEGIRWVLGQFAQLLATPVLVWILLLAAAFGSIRASGMLKWQHTYRASRARIVTVLFLVVYIGIILLMTAIPHAVLLSADGSLWPSPFSASLVTLVSFGLMASALIYGTVAGSFLSLADVTQALVRGIQWAAPLLLLYILLAQLYFSLRFVFSA
jgi:aminobenzoyl-glutamate transport protein